MFGAVDLASILLCSGSFHGTSQENVMDNRTLKLCTGLLGASALLVGCEPDAGERAGTEQSRPGDSALSRNESGQLPRADREPTVRPPTTAPNPAAPGSAAAPNAGAASDEAARLMARAEIRPVGDSTVRGIVEFHAAAGDEGPTTIDIMLMGLPAGPHGVHVHTGTDCAAPGEHLNPLDAPHGPANAASGMRHLGDLGNVTADAAGMVDETLRDSLLHDDASFVGRVLVVHEGQDDLATQPDGSAGEPIGCGVIEAAGEDVLSSSDSPNRGV
jgi:Cu-Zn family superoxide dismutase